MTANELLEEVHHTYEGSNDYPESGDDDYEIRFSLLKDGIRIWKSKNQNWRETYATLEDAVDGDKVTVASQTEYDCPTNFIRPSSFVKVGSIYLPYLPFQEMTNTLQRNPSEEFFTIIGYPGAYKLIINPAPESVLDIGYPYHKEVTIPSDGDDEIEVNRPNFLKYYILARMYEQDNRNDLVNFYESKMEEEESLATVDLVRTPGSALSKIKDKGASLYGSGFGK